MYTVGLDKFYLFLILCFFSSFSLYNYGWRSVMLIYGCLEGKLSIKDPCGETLFRTGPTVYRRNISSLKKEGDSEDINLVKEIIFGSVLGDGKLEIPPRGTNARFGFTQSKHNEDYFLFVFNNLSYLISAKYREYSYIDKRTNKTYTSLNF